MSDEMALAEAERQIANLIEIGNITAVDTAERRARMDIGGAETDWLPWAVARAGDTRTASAPSVGEQRLIFCPQGDLEQAVIGPAVYQDDFDAPSEVATQEVIAFSDGTRVEYDTETKGLTISVAAGGTVAIHCDQATITASDSVTIDAPSAIITGELTVQGSLSIDGAGVTHGGTNIGKTHKHGGVETGAGQTAGPS